MKKGLLPRSLFATVAVGAVAIGVRRSEPPDPVFALASQGCTVTRSEQSAFYDGWGNLGAALADFEQSSCDEPLEKAAERLRTRLKGWREVPIKPARPPSVSRAARGPGPATAT